MTVLALKKLKEERKGRRKKDHTENCGSPKSMVDGKLSQAAYLKQFDW
jgi:hypothetical protein